MNPPYKAPILPAAKARAPLVAGRAPCYSLRGARVAQLVEYLTENEGVPGSSPGPGTEA